MKNQIVKTFFELVQIDSTSGHEEQVIKYLENYFHRLKTQTIRDKYENLIVHLNGFDETLLLSAHCDTVEPGESIRPMIKNGIIMSKDNTILGADNKAGLAAIIEAVSFCKTNNIKHRAIDLVFTRSEEVANLGATNLDYKLISAKKGYTFDNANPIGTIISASPFYNRFDINILGKSSHSSRPENSVNTINIFIDAYNNLKFGKVSKKTVSNIGVLNAGHVRNTIPGEMQLKGDIRSLSEDEIEKETEKIKRVFSKSAKKFGGSISFKKVRENSGYEYSKTDSLIKNTVRIMEKNKIKPKLKMSWGVSDANIFKEHGIIVLDLGDGSIHPHTTDEAISVENLNTLNKLIFSLMTS